MLNAIRELIPKSYRVFLYGKYERIRLATLKIKILAYYKKKQEAQDNEITAALNFLSKNDLEVLPYPFIHKYKNLKVEVLNDPNSQLPYIVHEGHKIYFRRDWNKQRIANYFRGILAEQDKQSAHCYLSENYTVNDNSHVYDVGVAEGNFSLSIVEKVKSIHLFEADESWVEALEQTFAPWKEKVFIHNLFVTDFNDEGYISLDHFSKNNPVDFIKVDVDGGERNLLKGAAELLQNQKELKVVLCTYHQQNDAEEFKKIMTQHGFNAEFSNAYMLFHYDKLAPPYFRKGVLKTWK